MRLFVSALFILAAAAAFGQSQPAPQAVPAPEIQFSPQAGVLAPFGLGSQSSCPVVLTSARLNWPASYLPVTSAEKVTEPNLALGFQNSSGKAIRSATITARFLGKHNMYQLDANAFDLRLTFSGVDAAGKAEEQLREIRVPAKIYAYGVTRVSLDQVTFADGSFWTSWGHQACSLDVKGSAERVAK